MWFLSILFLIWPALIFPLLFHLYVLHFLFLEREEMYNDLSFDKHPGISWWELGSPRSEAHRTGRFSLWTHHLRNQAVSSSRSTGSCPAWQLPVPVSDPLWRNWDLPQVSGRAVQLQALHKHPQGGWGKWSSRAHPPTAATHSASLWGYYDSTCTFTHLCLLERGWWWSLGEETKCSVFPLC